MNNVYSNDATQKPIFYRNQDLIIIHHGSNGNVPRRATVDFTNNHVLGNIHKATGQIPGIRCTQCRIYQSFTGTVGGDDVFRYS